MLHVRKLLVTLSLPRTSARAVRKVTFRLEYESIKEWVFCDEHTLKEKKLLFPPNPICILSKTFTHSHTCHPIWSFLMSVGRFFFLLLTTTFIFFWHLHSRIWKLTIILYWPPTLLHYYSTYCIDNLALN